MPLRSCISSVGYINMALLSFINRLFFILCKLFLTHTPLTSYHQGIQFHPSICLHQPPSLCFTTIPTWIIRPRTSSRALKKPTTEPHVKCPPSDTAAETTTFARAGREIRAGCVTYVLVKLTSSLRKSPPRGKTMCNMKGLSQMEQHFVVVKGRLLLAEWFRKQ